MTPHKGLPTLYPRGYPKGNWAPDLPFESEGCRVVPVRFREAIDSVAKQQAWRIRLAAYGARLERVLGSRPRGFKSPILRSKPV